MASSSSCGLEIVQLDLIMVNFIMSKYYKTNILYNVYKGFHIFFLKSSQDYNNYVEHIGALPAKFCFVSSNNVCNLEDTTLEYVQMVITILGNFT